LSRVLYTVEYKNYVVLQQFCVRKGENSTYRLTVLGGRNVREDPENNHVFAYDNFEVEEYDINYVPNQLACT